MERGDGVKDADVVKARREQRQRLLTGQTAHAMHLALLLRNGLSSFPQDVADYLNSNEEWTSRVVEEVECYNENLVCHTDILCFVQFYNDDFSRNPFLARLVCPLFTLS